MCGTRPARSGRGRRATRKWAAPQQVLHERQQVLPKYRHFRPQSIISAAFRFGAQSALDKPKSKGGSDPITKSLRNLAFAAVSGCIGLAMLPSLQADTWNKKTTLTLTNPSRCRIAALPITPSSCSRENT